MLKKKKRDIFHKSSSDITIPSESVLLWLLTLNACASLPLSHLSIGAYLPRTFTLPEKHSCIAKCTSINAIAHFLPITVPGYDRYDCCCMCVQGEGGACSNCGVICTVTQVTAKGALCNSCYQHWRYVSYLVLDRERRVL